MTYSDKSCFISSLNPDECVKGSRWANRTGCSQFLFILCNVFLFGLSFSLVITVSNDKYYHVRLFVSLGIYRLYFFYPVVVQADWHSDTSGEADRPRERWRKRERKLIVAAKSCKREERAIEAEHGLRQVSPPECSLTHLDQQTALSRKKVHLKLFICLFIYLFLANVQWEEVVITQKEIASLGPNVCF